MSLGLHESRHAARRRRRWRLFKWLFMLALLVALGIAGFQSGKRLSQQEVYQTREEIARLKTRITELERENGALRVTAETARIREAQLRERYEQDVPRPELRALAAEAEKQLEQGAKMERLRFLLSTASHESECDGSPATKRFIVRTPLYDGANASVTFAEGRLTVTATGTPAEDAEGRVLAWFDPAKPVAFEVARLGGETSRFSGTLPLHHAVVLDGAEYRMSAVEGAQRGFIEVTADRCRFP